jgi:hypothetical protein
MSRLYNDAQRENIRRGAHPDCTRCDPCTVCGASETLNTLPCNDPSTDLTRRLFMAAAAADHNAQPKLGGSWGWEEHQYQARLFDEAAREILK